MIEYREGNMFTSDAEVLVNPVNCVGVMGAGLALQFKNKFPQMFQVYKEICADKEIVPGAPVLWLDENFDKKILLFPTKVHWKNPSTVEYVSEGLQAFTFLYLHWNISSIAWPLVGCGLGGLNWEYQVKPLMHVYLEPLPILNEIWIN